MSCWSAEPVPQGSTVLNVRPFKPIDLSGGGAMSMLWMAGGYPSYVGLRTRIMALGTDGRPFAPQWSDLHNVRPGADGYRAVTPALRLVHTS